MSRRKTPQEYHALAQLLGLIWRGPPVHSVTTMTTWECRCGNVFERTYNSIQQRNTGACKVCNKQVHKTTADYRALGESKELRWLGPVVTSVHHYTEWQCKRGHPPFKTSFHAIQRSGGNGCKHCSRKVPHTRAQYEALARKKTYAG
jgi:hypothetical protein